MPLPDFWYRAYFPLTRTLGDHAITGEATPRYITSIEYAKRAARIIPSAKFIVLLRDPVRRAYSHFKQALHFTGETLDFETLVTCEIRELEKSSYEAPAYWEASEHMVKRGLYASQIRGWLQYFPRDQFLIIQSEKMFADPQKITAAVCEFLGLAPEPTQTFSYGARGTSHSRGIDVPKMSPEIQDVLYRFYRPHNEELFTLIGETYDWAIDDGL
jgi:hypothetical protein